MSEFQGLEAMIDTGYSGQRRVVLTRNDLVRVVQGLGILKIRHQRIGWQVTAIDRLAGQLVGILEEEPYYDAERGDPDDVRFMLSPIGVGVDRRDGEGSA